MLQFFFNVIFCKIRKNINFKSINLGAPSCTGTSLVAQDLARLENAKSLNSIDPTLRKQNFKTFTVAVAFNYHVACTAF